MTNNPESGQFRYTTRGMRIDALAALEKSVVRGLVELITNADDAYRRMARAPGRAKILVEVERGGRGRNHVLRVKDRACGMTRDELVDNFSEGGRSTEAESNDGLRGFFGLGAKHCAAFGRLVVETIKEGWYSKFVMDSSFQWQALARDTGWHRRALPEDRQRLGIPDNGSGTCVTVEVNAEEFRLPRFDILCRELQSYYSLRDINSDTAKEIIIVDVGRRDQRRIRYSYPRGGETQFDGKLEIPEYADAAPHLVVDLFPEPFSGTLSDPTYQGGILIKSSRAIHGITLFGLEGNPYARRLSGRLIDPYLDVLLDEWNQRESQGEQHSPQNPFPVINRQRKPTHGGLEQQHPYVQALWAQARSVLDRLVDSIAEREQAASREIISESTRAAFGKLAPLLGRFIDEELEEATGGPGNRRPTGIRIIPPRLVMQPGQEKSAALYYSHPDNPPPTGTIQCRLVGDAVEILLAPREFTGELDEEGWYHEHQLIKVRALELGSAAVHLTLGESSSVLTVEVGNVPPPTPIDFGFERQSYTLRLGARKLLVVRVPLDDMTAHGDRVQVTLQGDAEVVLVSSPIAVARLDPELGCGIARFQVEARSVRATAVAEATLGPLSARARLRVRQDAGTALAVEFNDTVQPSISLERAAVRERDGSKVLEIYTRHPLVAPLLEPEPETQQNSPVFRTMEAEMITFAVVQYVLERQQAGARGGLAQQGVTDIYVNHHQKAGRLLKAVQNVLLPPQG
jgi:hypothetical protein